MSPVHNRRVILTPLEGGRYLAEVLSLPGCQTEGDSRDEAIAKIKELVPLYIQSLKENGQPIPDEWVPDDWEERDVVTI